jgi:hypothetical protein
LDRFDPIGPRSYGGGDTHISNYLLKHTTLLQEILDSMAEAKYFTFKKNVEDSFEQNEENLIRFGLNIFFEIK